MIETDAENGHQRVILVGLRLLADPEHHEGPLAELERLAATAGGTVVGRFVQRRKRPDSKYFIGRGKAQEVARAARSQDAHLILVDNDLSPAQERNLEELTSCTVVDRSGLILDIFATRARTTQARLQVELAQLQYTRSRLKRMWTHLERMEGAIGTRGPGEKQIEEDRRLIDRRIQALRRSLKVEERRRETRSRSRAPFFNVSLVGYTNAGKSTLLRALTGADTFIEDKLFATLDTQTRAWELAGNQRVFLSDTVGFIRDLPHNLVASFHSTLAEAVEADLLLHVVDASSPDAEHHMRVVLEVLREIGAGAPSLLVFNKVDAVADRMQTASLFSAHPDALAVSAVAGDGLPALGARVADVVQSFLREIELDVPAAAGRLLAFVAEKGTVVEREYTGERVRLRVRLAPRDVAHVIGHLQECDGRLVEAAGAEERPEPHPVAPDERSADGESDAA